MSPSDLERTARLGGESKAYPYYLETILPLLTFHSDRKCAADSRVS